MLTWGRTVKCWILLGYSSRMNLLTMSLSGKQTNMLHKWVDVNIDDMKKFIAMIIAMGLVQHQDIQDYWSKDEMLATPFFGRVKK